MTINTSDEYVQLYQSWMKEKNSTSLQSIPLNFFLLLEEKINLAESRIVSQDQFENLILKRIKFLFNSILLMRKHKIINSILTKQKLNSVYLTNSEKFFQDLFIIIEILLTAISDDLLETNISNLLKSIPESASIRNLEMNTNDKDNSFDIKPTELVNVRILKNIPKFVDEFDKIFGPFNINEITDLPRKICNEILFPKKFVELL